MFALRVIVAIGVLLVSVTIASAQSPPVTRLTNISNAYPHPSPDGVLIAFASNRSGPANVGQLYVVAPDGSGLRQITTGPWSYAQPAWSADGNTIYAYQNVETASYEFGDVVDIEVGD